MQFDFFALTSLAGYALLALIVLAAAPRQDRVQRAALAQVIAGTALAYAAGSPWIFVLGWMLSAWPVMSDSNQGWGTRMIHAGSAAALAAGFLAPQGSTAGFLLLVLAVMLRKGLFPVHFWIPNAFESGSLPVLSLLLNGHLGAFLMIRFAIPMFPDAARQNLSLLGTFAIVTSVYAALLGIVAARPRRILALLCASQAAFVLAGLENRNVEGITGALVHWWVVSFATTALLAVYRSLEVRTTEAAEGGKFLGLAMHAPRLAVFFAVGAVSLVGLPGTLGFAAEDLLFHGALESHAMLGIGLPLATALNAITAIRLLASLFFGKRAIHVPPIADALLRERLALTAPVLALVAGGLFPAAVISLRSGLATQIAAILSGGS